MENQHKINKRKQTKTAETKRKRGRPKSWSNSWQKRLVMLRLCGLRIEVIVELLNIMSKGCFDAKVRRAQQILNHVLSEGYQEDCPKDKAHSRSRIAFFRSLRKRRLGPNHETVESSISPKRMSYGRNALIASNSSLRKARSLGRQRATNPFWTIRPHIPTNDLNIRLVNEGDMSRMNSSSSVRYSISTLNSRYDTRSFISTGSVSSNVREILKRNSYSSSIVSEIVGVLRTRLSTSTLGTHRESSIYHAPVSVNEDRIVGCMVQARTALDNHQADIRMLNEAVIQGCCSQRVTCVHRDVLASSTQDRSAGTSSSSLLQTRAHDVSTLCFIAASGTSSEVISTAISSCGADIHGNNLDGQNFMFFLDTCGFSTDGLLCEACSTMDTPSTPRYATYSNTCTCQFSDQTALLRFENLLSLLEEKNFDFEHIDNEGRSFLSYLCPSPTFDINWLVVIGMRNNSWVSRLKSLSNKRDAAGCFLVDYIALHPDYESLSSATLAYFTPVFKPGPEGHLPYRALIGEDDNGTTALHNLSPESMRPFLMGLWDLQDEASNLLRNPSNINAYDCTGMTPLLKFVHRCIRNLVDEAIVISGLSLMILWGANVNARSRKGGTILHLTANAALPRLVSYIISLGVQIDLVDKDGFTALDHAAKAFNRSRQRHEPPELTGRSLKCAAKLQDASRTTLWQPPFSVTEE